MLPEHGNATGPRSLGDESLATGLETTAVVLESPRSLALRRVALEAPGEADVVVDLEWSGISTGTERLLFGGDMPDFPGMGYPLVPGYESVGRVTRAGPSSGRQIGERVFVPGASCFRDLRGLFGGAAARLVVPGDRARPIASDLGDCGTLMALAATASHALSAPGARPPELVIGHGVLGRLLCRLAVLRGAEPPVVWERDAKRCDAGGAYAVIDPGDDPRRDYAAVYDVSGDPSILDHAIARLAPGGEVVLAGFYSEPLRFDFAPAFLREARMRVAAEWKDEDLAAVLAEVASGALDLSGLITHRRPAREAASAYETAFTDPSCLKMILDWRDDQ